MKSKKSAILHLYPLDHYPVLPEIEIKVILEGFLEIVVISKKSVFNPIRQKRVQKSFLA
jgi:hypothetical protein